MVFGEALRAASGTPEWALRHNPMYGMYLGDCAAVLPLFT
jgi:hypothetical protein